MLRYIFIFPSLSLGLRNIERCAELNVIQFYGLGVMIGNWLVEITERSKLTHIEYIFMKNVT